MAHEHQKPQPPAQQEEQPPQQKNAQHNKDAQQQQQQPQALKPLTAQEEAKQAAKEAVEAQQAAQEAVKIAYSKQITAEEKTKQAASEVITMEECAKKAVNDTAQLAAKQAAESQKDTSQKLLEQSAAQHLAGQQVAQSAMCMQGPAPPPMIITLPNQGSNLGQPQTVPQQVPLQQQAAFAQQFVLNAANQAASSANMEMGIAQTPASDPFSQQVARAHVEAAQQKMLMAQQLAVAAESPETAIQAAAAVQQLSGSQQQ